MEQLPKLPIVYKHSIFGRLAIQGSIVFVAVAGMLVFAPSDGKLLSIDGVVTGCLGLIALAYLVQLLQPRVQLVADEEGLDVRFLVPKKYRKKVLWKDIESIYVARQQLTHRQVDAIAFKMKEGIGFGMIDMYVHENGKTPMRDGGNASLYMHTEPLAETTERILESLTAVWQAYRA